MPGGVAVLAGVAVSGMLGGVGVAVSGMLAVLVAVLVGVLVAVLVGVLVAVLVGVLVAVLVGVLVAVLVGVLVAVLVGVLVAVLVGVLVAMLVAVLVAMLVAVLPTVVLVAGVVNGVDVPIVSVAAASFQAYNGDHRVPKTPTLSVYVPAAMYAGTLHVALTVCGVLAARATGLCHICVTRWPEAS